MKHFIILLLLNLSFSIYAYDKWEYIERIDPMTDKDTSIAFIEESNCNHNCSSLIVRADGNIIFKFSQFMDNEPIKIEYRFDKTSMSYTTASISTDGTAGFLSNYEEPEFIAKLMHYSELTVRSFNFRGTPATFHVSLNNSSQAIKKLTVFSDAKTLGQLKKEQAELDEIIKSNSGKGEIASLKAALETVKLVAGEGSEAYKQVKTQYEAALKKAPQIN